MTAQEIISAIEEGEFTKNEIDRMWATLKISWNRVTTRESQELSRKFRIGDPVTFRTKNGSIVTGTINRLNQKTVSLNRVNGVKWRVDYSLLKAA